MSGKGRMARIVLYLDYQSGSRTGGHRLHARNENGLHKTPAAGPGTAVDSATVGGIKSVPLNAMIETKGEVRVQRFKKLKCIQNTEYNAGDDPS